MRRIVDAGAHHGLNRHAHASRGTKARPAVLRVSSEDQAERGTIGMPRTLLQDLAEAFESQFADAETLLTRCRDQFEQTDAILTKRQIMDLLVWRTPVVTDVWIAGVKPPAPPISYTFAGCRSRAGFSIGTPTTEPYSVHEPS